MFELMQALVFLSPLEIGIVCDMVRLTYFH